MEEIDAKDQLLLLNRGESLEKLDPSQVDEEHEAYLHIFAQAKDTNAKRDAIRDRLMLLRERKKKEAKNMQIQQ